MSQQVLERVETGSICRVTFPNAAETKLLSCGGGDRIAKIFMDL